jgi:hypothetical protein
MSERAERAVISTFRVWPVFAEKCHTNGCVALQPAVWEKFLVMMRISSARFPLFVCSWSFLSDAKSLLTKQDVPPCVTMHASQCVTVRHSASQGVTVRRSTVCYSLRFW